jgi:hypothetical protein
VPENESREQSQAVRRAHIRREIQTILYNRSAWSHLAGEIEDHSLQSMEELLAILKEIER